MGSFLKEFLNGLEKYFEGVPGRLRKKRFIVWTFFIATTIALSMGLPKNKLDMSFESWFSDDDPVKQAVKHFRAQFGGDEFIYLVYKPKDGDLFSAESLKAVKGIRNELLNFRKNLKEGETSKLERVTRVDSIVNAKILEAKDGSLIARQFIGDNFPINEKDKEKLRSEANNQKTFPLLYFSKDFQYGAILIQTDLESSPVQNKENSAESEFDDSEGEFSMEADKTVQDQKIEFEKDEMDEYVGLMEAVHKVIDQKKYADRLEYYPVGNPPVMAYFDEQIKKQLLPLSIGMIVIIVVLMGVLFKSFSAIAWANAVIILSCVWTMGISGWLGIVVTDMVTLTLLLILSVGIANSVHILSAYQSFRNEERPHEEALRLSFQKTALPCLLSCLTTVIGMMAITLSPIGHIKTFGYMSALGISFAFILSVYLLPLMLDIWAPSAGADEKGMGKLSFLNPSQWTRAMLKRVQPVVEKSPLMVIGFFVTLFIICVYGSTLVIIDSNLVETTGRGSKIRRDYEVVDRKMAGAQLMEIYVKTGVENAFQDPLMLKTFDEFQKTIETKYKDLVARSYSLTDVVKESYKALNEGREDYYVIPDDPDVLSQTLFLFNNANITDRRQMVSDDYSQSHITVRLYNAGSYRYTDFFDKVTQDINETFDGLRSAYPAMEVSVTGGLALLMRLADYIAWSQVKSLGFVILVISVIMIFVFGSIKVGVLSILPNLIPSILTFGLMGLLGVPLDADTLIIAPVIIGIAVDDTIHFITHYRSEILKNADVRRAVQKTLKEVGQAISFNRWILGFGFLIMSFSPIASLMKVGIFGSAAIFMALFSNLFFLSALILTFKPRFLTGKEKAALKSA